MLTHTCIHTYTHTCIDCKNSECGQYSLDTAYRNRILTGQSPQLYIEIVCMYTYIQQRNITCMHVDTNKKHVQGYGR